MMISLKQISQFISIIYYLTHYKLLTTKDPLLLSIKAPLFLNDGILMKHYYCLLIMIIMSLNSLNNCNQNLNLINLLVLHLLVFLRIIFREIVALNHHREYSVRILLVVNVSSTHKMYQIDAFYYSFLEDYVAKIYKIIK